MQKPLLALALATVALAGCTPSALQAAVQAGMAANGGAGASATPGATASAKPVASADPSPAPTPSVAASADAGVSADVAALAGAFMDAVDAAAEQEPEMVMRLFVTGLATYGTDPALGRAMMGYALRSNLNATSATSPTGYEPQNADAIYFRAIEKNPKIGALYLDDLASADLDFMAMAPKVQIDAEYAAWDKGLAADGKQWTWYLKVNHASGVRSRPIRCAQDGDRGWRVSNYNSLMVLP